MSSQEMANICFAGRLPLSPVEGTEAPAHRQQGTKTHQ